MGSAGSDKLHGSLKLLVEVGGGAGNWVADWSWVESGPTVEIWRKACCWAGVST